jgi:hypothetical protein
MAMTSAIKNRMTAATLAFHKMAPMADCRCAMRLTIHKAARIMPVRLNRGEGKKRKASEQQGGDEADDAYTRSPFRDGKVGSQEKLVLIQRPDPSLAVGKGKEAQWTSYSPDGLEL